MGKNNKAKSKRFKEKSYDDGDAIRKLQLLSEKKGLQIWQLNSNEIDSCSEDSENENLSESAEDETNDLNIKSEENIEDLSEINQKNKKNDEDIKINYNGESSVEVKKEDYKKEEEVITSMNSPNLYLKDDYIIESIFI